MSLIPAEQYIKEDNMLKDKSIVNAGSITLTLSNGYRGLLIGISQSGTRCFIALVAATASAGTVTVIPLLIPIDSSGVLGSDITYNTSVANKLTITKTGNPSVNIYDFTFEGTIL